MTTNTDGAMPELPVVAWLYEGLRHLIEAVATAGQGMEGVGHG